MNIIFDADKSVGESEVTFEYLYDGPKSKPVNSYQYVIGIKDAESEQSLEKAFYDGVCAANANNGSSYTVNQNGEAYLGYPLDWTHNMRVSYDAGTNSCYLTRDIGKDSSVPYDWLFYDKGTVVSEGMIYDKDESAKGGESGSDGFIVHTGPQSSQNNSFFINDMHTKKMGIDSLELTTRSKAEAAISKIEIAINYSLKENTRLGSYHHRLEMTMRNLTIAHENVTSAESVIRDADMAKTMADYATNNVLLQASQSMLAQSNQNSNSVLNLLS